MTAVTFIGAGNIAQAIMGGLLASMKSDDDAITITAADSNLNQLEKLPAQVLRSQDNPKAIRNADAVVLCVKPNMMATICKNLSTGAQVDNKGQLLYISVAAGITTAAIQTWLPENAAIIRCMPNTPALVQAGMTGLFANENVTSAQKILATRILSAVGTCEWFDTEAMLDVVTAISGSGPAYYFLMMEAMQKAGESLGLSPAIAKKLVLETALGAAKMASQSEISTEQLRVNVTSPGGTTEAAINTMLAADFKEIMAAAVNAAHNQSKVLSKA